MNKICLMVNNIEQINTNADAIIIGLKNYNSLNILELDIDKIKNLNTNKEVIISINRIIKNSEIDDLRNVLRCLEGYKIIFDDLAIYQIVNEMNLNIELIWGNIRATTSYNSINAYYNLNVKSAIISPDITLNEIIEISKNTKSKLFVPLYGKYTIFSSYRFLITNYLKYINKERKNRKYTIQNKDLYYDIYEDKNGTHIVNSKIVNGIVDYKDILDNNIEYILINTYGLDCDITNLVDSFITLRSLYYDNLLDIKTLVNYHNKFTNINTSSGFLHKKSIYKVGDINE